MGEAVQPIFNALVTLALVAFVFYRRTALREALPFWVVFLPAVLLFVIEVENVASLLFAYSHPLVHRLLFFLFTLSLLGIAWFIPSLASATARGGEEP